MSPRSARSHLSTHTYFHICVKGNNGQTIFLNEADFLRYLTLIERYQKQNNLLCFAYCLMSNHAHILFRSPTLKILSKTMQAIQVAYAMYFNLKYKRKGHLFQDRFTSWVIKDEPHLFATKEYIENNPVKAGIVLVKDNYAWSSACRDSSRITLNKITI